MKGPQPFQTQIYFPVTLFCSLVSVLKMLHLRNTNIIQCVVLNLLLKRDIQYIFAGKQLI